MTIDKFYKILNLLLPVTSKSKVERIALLLGLAIKVDNLKLDASALEIHILEFTAKENLRSGIRSIFKDMMDKSFSETLIRTSDIEDDSSMEIKRKRKGKRRQKKPKTEVSTKSIGPNKAQKTKFKTSKKKATGGIVFVGKIPSKSKPGEIIKLYTPTSLASENEEDPLHRK